MLKMDQYREAQQVYPQLSQPSRPSAQRLHEPRQDEAEPQPSHRTVGSSESSVFSHYILEGFITQQQISAVGRHCSPWQVLSFLQGPASCLFLQVSPWLEIIAPCSAPHCSSHPLLLRPVHTLPLRITGTTVRHKDTHLLTGHRVAYDLKIVSSYAHNTAGGYCNPYFSDDKTKV